MYMQTCRQLNAGLPLYVGLSFCSAKECTLRYDGGGYWTSTGTSFGRDVVVLPEILIEGENADVPHLLKPIFDIVWKCFRARQNLTNIMLQGNGLGLSERRAPN